MTIKDIKSATKDYPRFSDGRIDYSNERVCFVLNCVVVSGTHILLTKRSADVIAYPHTVNGVSGFIDMLDKPLTELARQELQEELDAPLQHINNLVVSEPFIQIDNEINREWHVFAVLVEFSHLFTPVTNWENKSATWYPLASVKSMKLMKVRRHYRLHLVFYLSPKDDGS